MFVDIVAEAVKIAYDRIAAAIQPRRYRPGLVDKTDHAIAELGAAFDAFRHADRPLVGADDQQMIDISFPPAQPPKDGWNHDPATNHRGRYQDPEHHHRPQRDDLDRC